ncbi:MAG: cobalt-zinc-cadmium efflux system protein [Sphingomonadales bacterium]|jgi:cobalt-zinc-cadmium efflux system protein|nr:cobalt-zinc-cadmium efflux system protein [Sphingomonadales bacterium]
MTASGSHGGHDHSHGPGHSHAPADFGRAFLVGTTLNVGFVAVEAVYGITANSMALLADAGHNLSDVLGLLVAWGAARLTKRAPTERFTYGMRKSTVLAALFNAVFLLVAVGAIILEAIQRLSNPEPISGITIMTVAAIGVIINGITAWLFARGAKGDINIRAAFLHMTADAGVSFGVILAGFIILKTGLMIVDPIVTLVIAAIILLSTWGLLRDSVSMSLDAVPAGIDPVRVEMTLRGLPGVTKVHDLHIWPMSTTEVALTCHLVMVRWPADPSFLGEAVHLLKDRHQIDHSTIQIETSPEMDCSQAPDDKV